MILIGSLLQLIKNGRKIFELLENGTLPENETLPENGKLSENEKLQENIKLILG